MPSLALPEVVIDPLLVMVFSVPASMPSLKMLPKVVIDPLLMMVFPLAASMPSALESEVVIDPLLVIVFREETVLLQSELEFSSI